MNNKFPLRKSFFLKICTLLLLLTLVLTGCTNCDRCDCDCDRLSFDLFSLSRKVHGSGNVVPLERNLESFSQVVLSEEGDLFIELGDRERLVVEAEDNIQEYLVAEINQGVLEIKKAPEKIQLNATEPIRYYLTVTNLDSLTIKNSGDAEVAEVNTDHFRLQVTGSGGVHIGVITASQLDVTLSSSGGLTIDGGVVERQNIRLTSSGDYDGRNVTSRFTTVHLSSSGNASVHVLDKLEADLSSSGNVSYRGNPSVNITDSSSSGRVIRMP